MSAADNHKIRSSRGHAKKRYTLAPRKTPTVSRSNAIRRRRFGQILSSLFFKRKSEE